MGWIVQHPNGEYVTEIKWRGYVRTTPLIACAKVYQRQVARKMINEFAPGWIAINIDTGQAYEGREAEGE